jgi:general secretion pathway protein A
VSFSIPIFQNSIIPVFHYPEFPEVFAHLYTNFYGLNEKPFDLTASPRFLYLGEGHKEALAVLTYGVKERQGFILLTGEVGTGKSTMVQALLANLDKSVIHAHLTNPLLSVKEFIGYLGFAAFKKWLNFKSKAQFLYLFGEFLNRCHQHQKHFILIIDEAHRLSFDLLEEIRLLSNMEKAEEKLLSIFLVGQPELDDKLRDPRCRPLLQRISVRYHIKPLNFPETEEYLTKRLVVAGAQKGDDIFPSAVRKAIHEYSKGFPRLINILSDHLLLLGYARGQRKLTPEMVRECFRDLKLDDALAATAPEPEIVAKEHKVSPSPARHGFWKWALIAILVIVFAAAAYQYREEIRTRVINLVNRYSKHESSVPVEKQKGTGLKISATARSLTGQREEKSPGIAKPMIPSTGKAEKKTPSESRW